MSTSGLGAPVATDDLGSTDQNTPLTVNVLANDTDPDGDLLSVSAAMVTTGLGSVTIEADGSLTYDAGSAYVHLGDGESETVEITYTVSDGNGGTDEAVLTVTVEGFSDALAATDDLGSTDQNTPLTVNVLANDTDPDGDLLSVSAATVTTGLGSVTIGADGSIIYDAGGAYDHLGDGESETVEITYTVSDGNGGTDEGVLTVTVEGLSGRTVRGTNKSDVIDANFKGGLGTTGGDDTVFAGNGADVVFGYEDGDELRGGNGRDKLHGDEGADSLFGGNGRDLLEGGLGDDLLSGGRGRDVLTGGAGADVFVFGRANGADVITDFDALADSLQFEKGTRIKDVSLVDADGTGELDTVLRLSNGSATVLGTGDLGGVAEWNAFIV